MTDVSGTRPAPSATGTLAATPFANVLVYVRNKRLTGTLVLRGPDGREASIGFWRGRIRRVAVNPPILPLGTILQMMQLIDRPTLEASLAHSMPAKRLLGEVLVERGAMTTEQRDKALLEQAARRVFDLFGLPPATAYGFYDAQPEVETPPHLLDTLVPVWNGLKAAPPKDVEGALARVATAPLRLVNEGALYTVGFDPTERKLVQALSRKPMTLRELRALVPSPSDADLVAYLLLIAKCVEPVTTSAGAMPAVSAPPPSAGGWTASKARESAPMFPPNIAASLPPKRRESAPMMPVTRPSAPDRQIVLPTPSTSAMRAPAIAAHKPPSSATNAAVNAKTLPSPTELGASGIVARAAMIEKLSFFEALGVPEGASTEASRSAYIRLAKLWHPDRLPGELASVRREVASVFAVISRAHDTLTNEAARTAYVAQRKDSAARQVRRDASLKAADDALARRDFFVVEREAKAIIASDVNDADGLALLAWCACLAGTGPDPLLRSVLTILDRAVEAGPACLRASLYRGLVWKRLGDLDAALRDFRQVLTLDPSHAQAAKEVSVLGTRMRTGTSIKAQGFPPAKTKT